MDASDTITPDELKQLATAMKCPTQELFAEALGVTQAYVSQLYNGQKTVKPGPLLNLIRRLQAEHLPGRKKRT